VIRTATSSVRSRNDGEDFHLLWTARRALRMLDKRSGLVAVSIEGCSGLDDAIADHPAELIVDTAEYYGSEDFALADRVEYVQLKHSTVRTDEFWTAATLASTVAKFATLFLRLCETHGQDVVIDRLRCVFVSNRPIDPRLQDALDQCLRQEDGDGDPFLAGWKTRSGLDALQFQSFLRILQLKGCEPNRVSQDNDLRGDLARLSPKSLDENFRDSLVEFVRARTLSQWAHDPVIRQAALLNCLGVRSPEDMFPAPSTFVNVLGVLPRRQEAAIADAITGAHAPVLIHAAGGVGKSVLAGRLSKLMPPGSVTVVFDGFAGGDYRKPSQPRHLHDQGLVQIANELAEQGLCDPLLPRNAAPHDYLRAFMLRLEQAAMAVRQRHPNGLVQIVLDAADNSEDAARERNDGGSFASDLVQETLPTGCRLVLLARTERRDRFPRRVRGTSEISLEPFDQDETAKHLRTVFPDADAGAVSEFHRYTGGNPRIQFYLLKREGSLRELLARLGPGRRSVDEQIGLELEDALAGLRGHSGDEAGIDALCVALAALPPRVPIRVLAKAAGVQESAIESFVADLGQPLLCLDGFVQFRDEPVERWFRDRFCSEPADYERLIAKLSPWADNDAYVASAWPGLLFHANRHEILFSHALGAEPDIKDSLERRAIVRERLRFGLKVARQKSDHIAIAQLLLRMGEAAAAEERQRELLFANDDLIAALWSPERVRETVFRQRAGGWYGVAHARYAAMLAPNPDYLAEARQSLRLAREWLGEWVKLPPEERRSTQFDEDDAAAFARASLFLFGADDCVDWIGRWKNAAFRFRIAYSLATSLLDRGDESLVQALMLSASDEAHAGLGFLCALADAGGTPSQEVIARMADAWGVLKLESSGDEIYSGKLTGQQGLIILAEMMARAGFGCEAVLAHLERFMPDLPEYLGSDSIDFMNGRSVFLLRAYTLKAALNGAVLSPEELMPSRLKRDGKPLAHDYETDSFQRVYGLLTPWYQLRAESLLGRYGSDELKRRARQLADSRVGHAVDWSWREDASFWANHIALLWWDAISIGGGGDNDEVGAIEGWLAKKSRFVFATTWSKLAWRAARAGLGDLALLFCGRARELITDSREHATTEAQSWLDLARAILPVFRDEAAACFEFGLGLLEARLGDESRDWLDVLLEIAKHSEEIGSHHPEFAYRLARAAELIHENNDHKFPWATVSGAVARLCPASALALAGRWADRDVADISSTVTGILPQLVSDKHVSCGQALSLWKLASDWRRGELLEACLFRTPSLTDRGRLLAGFVDELALEAPDRYEAEKLKLVADRFGLTSEKLDKLLSRPLDCETRRQRDTLARLDVSSKEPLFLEGDFTCPEVIDRAMQTWAGSRQADGVFVSRDDVVRQMAEKVPLAQRLDHIRAWLGVESLSATDILFSLQEIGKAWGTGSLAVSEQLLESQARLISQRAGELLLSGFSIGFLFGRRGEESALLPDYDLAPFIEAASLEAGRLNARVFFQLTMEVVKRLSSDEAREVLAYGLERIERMQRESDGDGSWQPRLTPPENMTEAVADLLWARLASPFAEQRWRAAHAVRRLGQMNEQATIDALMRRIESAEGGAFVDLRLPFYSLHACLYLLIALARLAQEHPVVLQKHAGQFSRLAFDGLPHVLMRAFAVDAALALNLAFPGTYTNEVIVALKSVNCSKLSSEKRQQYIGSTGRRDHIGYELDLKPYWFEPLGVVFGVSVDEVTDQVVQWVSKDCVRGAWPSGGEPRREQFRRQRASPYKSEQPAVDNHEFYLAYHAMFCVAGELLSEYPLVIDRWESNVFDSWLRRHRLARTDGMWLSDFRDPWPIERRPWQNEECSENWRWEIARKDFENVLCIDEGLPAKLPVWGEWHFSEGSRTEEFSISSALVAETAAESVLCQLQIARDPNEGFLPDDDHYEAVRLGRHRIWGWIKSPDSVSGLDQFDPNAGKLPFPAASPGKEIRASFDLHLGEDGRRWYSGAKGADMAFCAEIWGGRTKESDYSYPEFGRMLYVGSDFLKMLLKRLKRCLIVKVEISRRESSYARDSEYLYVPPYYRLFVIDSKGRIRSL
jgi:hypothetical protein